MKQLKAISLLTVFLSIGFSLFSQNCIEPSRVSPFYRCNYPRYEPVCGCDKVTYRNQCEAYWVGGNNFWDYGICDELGIDVYPNPVTQNAPLNITIQFPDLVNGNVTMYVIDSYAKVRSQRYFGNRNRIEFSMDTYRLPIGVYTIILTTDTGIYKFVRFIKA